MSDLERLERILRDEAKRMSDNAEAYKNLGSINEAWTESHLAAALAAVANCVSQAREEQDAEGDGGAYERGF